MPAFQIYVTDEELAAWGSKARVALERGEITRHARQTSALGTWIKAMVRKAEAQQAAEEAGDVAVE